MFGLRKKRRERPGRKEGGFLLLGTITTILVGAILSGMMAKEWSVIEKREREEQLLFVQEQYAAAILRFQKDQGRFPTELKELIENKGQKNQLFIRKAWTDPLYRDSTLEDWCLLQVGGSGRVVSSCSREGDPNELGLGGSFELGQQATMQQNTIQGLDAGAKGIVGVHSKSTDNAFNTIKRGEETYNRWHYTFDQYDKDMNARGIPGVTQGTGQGVGNLDGGLNNNSGGQ